MAERKPSSEKSAGADQLAEYVKAVVASAPKLTDDQLARLRVLLQVSR